MFDVITSAIKQKPLKVYKQPEPPVQKVTFTPTSS